MNITLCLIIIAASPLLILARAIPLAAQRSSSMSLDNPKPPSFMPVVAPGFESVREKDAVGPIKMFALRGVKDPPPCLDDGRLLTLDDTFPIKTFPIKRCL